MYVILKLHARTIFKTMLGGKLVVKPSLAEQISQIKRYHFYPLLRVGWPDCTAKYD